MSIHILDIQMVDFRRTLEVTEATVVIDFRLCETLSCYLAITLPLNRRFQSYFDHFIERRLTFCSCCFFSSNQMVANGHQT